METFQNIYDLLFDLEVSLRTMEKNPTWSEEMTTLDISSWLKHAYVGSDQQIFMIWGDNQLQDTWEEPVEINH